MGWVVLAILVILVLAVSSKRKNKGISALETKPLFTAYKQVSPRINYVPKEPLEQKLVSNVSGKERIWKYPPVSLLDGEQSSFYSILLSEPMRKITSKLGVALGFDALGNPISSDLAITSNLLITGNDNSGKTSLIKIFLASLLFRASPSEVKLIIVDPSKLGLTCFNGIPHLLSPVIVEPEKVISALRWLMAEMSRRYKLFVEAGAKNIDVYNEMSGFQALPYIVTFIDDCLEIDAFSPMEYRDGLGRIFETGQKTGIYAVLSSTKPDREFVNMIQSRIAFSSEARNENQSTIARSVSFLAPHDFVFVKNKEIFPTCLQSPKLIDKDLIRLITFIKDQGIPSQYSEKAVSSTSSGVDDLFPEAVKTVCQYDRATASLLQRRLSIGYARAARMMDQLVAAGVIAAADGSSKPQEVLIQNAQEFFDTYGKNEHEGTAAKYPKDIVDKDVAFESEISHLRDMRNRGLEFTRGKWRNKNK